MTECIHLNQAVERIDGIMVQSCRRCKEIQAKWDINQNGGEKLLFEVDTLKIAKIDH